MSMYQFFSWLRPTNAQYCTVSVGDFTVDKHQTFQDLGVTENRKQIREAMHPFANQSRRNHNTVRILEIIMLW